MGTANKRQEGTRACEQTSPDHPGSSYSQQDTSGHRFGEETNQDLEAPTSICCSHGETPIPAPVSLAPRWEKSPIGWEKSPSGLEKHPAGLEKHPSGLEKHPSGLEKHPSSLEKSPMGF